MREPKIRVQRNDQCPNCYEISSAMPEVITIVRNDENGYPDHRERHEIRRCEVCGVKWSRKADNQTFTNDVEL